MYRVKTTGTFDKQLKKLDPYTVRMIVKWISKHLEGCADPRITGKALTANLSGYWRYRIGDYRLIAEIQDDVLVILAIAVSHRKDIYKR